MYKPKPAAQKELLSHLKDERSKLQDLCWELDDLERLLTDVDDGVQQVSTQAEAQLRQRRERLEEAVLHQMLYIDRLEHRLNHGPASKVQAA